MLRKKRKRAVQKTKIKRRMTRRTRIKTRRSPNLPRAKRKETLRRRRRTKMKTNPRVGTILLPSPVVKENHSIKISYEG